jgi:hypothetical protein
MTVFDHHIVSHLNGVVSISYSKQESTVGFSSSKDQIRETRRHHSRKSIVSVSGDVSMDQAALSCLLSHPGRARSALVIGLGKRVGLVKRVTVSCLVPAARLNKGVSSFPRSSLLAASFKNKTWGREAVLVSSRDAPIRWGRKIDTRRRLSESQRVLSRRFGPTV